MGIECELLEYRYFEREKQQPVKFESTVDVLPGVWCDVYSFVEDPTKDLGVIRINPGRKTPLQKVLQGKSTLEGYISGKGELVITRGNGEEEIYKVGENPQKELLVNVGIGDFMQWHASETGEGLTAYEVCYPPYQDGRYENIGDI